MAESRYNHKAAMRLCQRRLREARRGEGLCLGCGAEAADGRRYCPVCLAKRAERENGARRRRVDAGVCVRCGGPAYKGRRMCRVHLAAEAAYQKAHRRRRAEERQAAMQAAKQAAKQAGRS